MQCALYILLPTPPPGSGFEADIFAGMSTVEVVVHKVMVDDELRCASGVHYIHCSTSVVSLGHAYTVNNYRLTFSFLLFHT